MKKIAMIIPYFGKFPEWINMYLYSCSYQKLIDFHYFTDCEQNNTNHAEPVIVSLLRRILRRKMKQFNTDK